MSKICNNRVSKAVLFILVLLCVLSAFPDNVSASEKKIFVTNDMEDGEYYDVVVVNDISVIGTNNDKIVVESDAVVKKYGEYEFSKHINLKGKGSTNYRTIKFTVAKSKIITIFAKSDNVEEDRTLLLANSKGEVVDKKVVTKAEGDNVMKIIFELPDFGTYYVYSENKPVWVYGIYCGGLSEQEFVELGKVVNTSETGYVTTYFMPESEEPVFLISLAVFFISLVLCLIILISSKGRSGVKNLVSVEKKSTDDVIYKE